LVKKVLGKMKTWLSKTGDDTIDIETFEKTISNYTESFKFNKVVSSFMILLNQNKNKSLTKSVKKN
jgi:hypothetical protein